jgi:hypothetical protein
VSFHFARARRLLLLLLLLLLRARERAYCLEMPHFLR